MTEVVILDRDGTILVERDYLSSPEEVELLPNAVRGLRRMVELGYRLVLVTNQSGIGRGLFGVSQLAAVNARMEELLRDEGIQIAGIWYCPHHPDDKCACRKPNTKLVEEAADALGFDPRRSIVIGDKASDMQLGKRIGATTILVRTGYGAQTAVGGNGKSDRVANDLLEAAHIVAGLPAAADGPE